MPAEATNYRTSRSLSTVAAAICCVDPTGHSGFATANEAAQHATRPGDTLIFAAAPASVDITVNTNEDLDFTIPYDVPTTVTLSGSGSAHVTTGDGADFVVTGDGADTIHTGGGNDVVDAGPGRRRHRRRTKGGGDDVYDGGTGGNTVSYPSATNSITVDLNLRPLGAANHATPTTPVPMWTPSAT